MLTISKPPSAGQAQTYHQKEFTAKEQNYWSQQGVIAGEWQGRLARQFGLGFHSRPATLRRPPFCPFNRVALFFLATALVKEKTSRHRQNGKNMKLEEVNLKTKEAVDFLVQSLASGQSAVLTQYLGAMAKFRNYSFLCVQ
jgi:hypothetical protein